MAHDRHSATGITTCAIERAAIIAGQIAVSQTVVNLDVHEMTDNELQAYGPIMDSPGTSPEEDDEASVEDDDM
jgi:hypothetical protein